MVARASTTFCGCAAVITAPCTKEGLHLKRVATGSGWSLTRKGPCSNRSHWFHTSREEACFRQRHRQSRQSWDGTPFRLAYVIDV